MSNFEGFPSFPRKIPKNLEAPANSNSGGGASSIESADRVREAFKTRTFLVVEDNKWAGGEIVGQLQAVASRKFCSTISQFKFSKNASTFFFFSEVKRHQKLLHYFRINLNIT